MTYQNQLRPWCIVRQLPEMQHVMVERFRRYQDADAHVSALRRLTPNSAFTVIFDPDTEMSMGNAH